MPRIGKRVRFIGYCDDIVPRDPIMDIGDEGTVVAHDPQDIGPPMNVVWVRGRGKDGYWDEELELVDGR